MHVCACMCVCMCVCVCISIFITPTLPYFHDYCSSTSAQAFVQILTLVVVLWAFVWWAFVWKPILSTVHLASNFYFAKDKLKFVMERDTGDIFNLRNFSSLNVVFIFICSVVMFFLYMHAFFLCVCVCMCVCMCTCMHVCACVCVSLCVHVCLCVRLHIHHTHSTILP